MYAEVCGLNLFLNRTTTRNISSNSTETTKNTQSVESKEGVWIVTSIVVLAVICIPVIVVYFRRKMKGLCIITMYFSLYTTNASGFKSFILMFICILEYHHLSKTVTFFLYSLNFFLLKKSWLFNLTDYKVHVHVLFCTEVLHLNINSFE